MTPPFILALAMGVSKIKGADRAEIDLIGRAGVASSEPVVAILILGMFITTSTIGQQTVETVKATGFMEGLLTSLIENGLAVLPVTLLFFIINSLEWNTDNKK